MNDCSACCVEDSDVVEEVLDPEVADELDEEDEESEHEDAPVDVLDVLPSTDTPTLDRACMIALISPPPGGGGGGVLPEMLWLAFRASVSDERFETLDVLSCVSSELRFEMLLMLMGTLQ
jgi:hypothetical protein